MTDGQPGHELRVIVNWPGLLPVLREPHVLTVRLDVTLERVAATNSLSLEEASPIQDDCDRY
jgi:hypothetical protein